MYTVCWTDFSGKDFEQHYKYFTDALSYAESLNQIKVPFVEILEDEKQILKFEN